MSNNENTNRKSMGQFQFINMNEKEREKVLLIDPKSEYRGNAGTGKPFDMNNVAQMMKNEEIKTIIHDFYRKEYKYFVSVGVDELLSNNSTADEGYRFIMWQLEKELAWKDEYEGLNDMENSLFFILLNDSSKQHDYVYSGDLVNLFKNVFD